MDHTDIAQIERDQKVISDLGGPSKVAELLGFPKAGGQQRVQNWLGRGIPAAIKVKRPDLFMHEAPQGAARSAEISEVIRKRPKKPVPKILDTHVHLQPPASTALASGLELVDRRTGPDNRRVAPQPFEGLDRRVALEPRRAIDRAKADIANAA